MASAVHRLASVGYRSPNAELNVGSRQETCRPRFRPQMRSLISASLTLEADAATFLRDVAAVDPPSALPQLLKTLQHQGMELTSPSNRKGMVPLIVPLARNADAGSCVGLLRWPTALDGMELPVVSWESNGTLHLLAKTSSDYINRALAEDDASASSTLFSALSGPSDNPALEFWYKPGDYASSGLPKMDVFLTRKVALFPDVLERLALSHLSSGDEVSALVTGEFYANPKHFPGFGRPFMFNAQLLSRVGRPSEARDAVRIALRSPWWTLGVPYQEAAELAGHGDTLLEFARERISEEGREVDLQKGKSPAQVSLDQAAFVLDVATAECDWDGAVHRLASLYEEAGLPQIAAFVRYGY